MLKKERYKANQKRRVMELIDNLSEDELFKVNENLEEKEEEDKIIEQMNIEDYDVTSRNDEEKPESYTDEAEFYKG